MVQRQLELFPLSTSMKLLLLLVVLARCSCSIVAAPAADTIGAVSTDAERGRPARQVDNAAGAAYGEELEDADDHDSDTSEEAPADIVTTALVVACSAADDFAVHSAAGRQKGRKNNARSRTWESVGGDEERTFVESYRRKIDAGGASSREVFASGFKIHLRTPRSNTSDRISVRRATASHQCSSLCLTLRFHAWCRPCRVPTAASLTA